MNLKSGPAALSAAGTEPSTDRDCHRIDMEVDVLLALGIYPPSDLVEMDTLRSPSR